MADQKGSALSPISVIDRATDKLYVIDATGPTSGANTINSVLGISSAPLGLTDTQSPTNKTFDNSNIYTIRDDRLTLQDSADITKQAQIQLSSITAGQTRVYTFPDRTGTLVTLSGNQTFTGTITMPGAVLDQATITRPTLQIDSVAEYTAASGVTIDGLLIKDGLLPAGNIQPLNLTSGTGSSWNWQSWVPTWTNFTTGNGTLNYAKYLQIGKDVHFRLKFTLGSTSVVSGNIIFSLPVTANADYSSATDMPTASGQLNDATANRWQPRPCFNSTTTVAVFYQNSSANIANISSTAPFTWTTSDQVMISGVYEAA